MFSTEASQRQSKTKFLKKIGLESNPRSITSGCLARSLMSTIQSRDESSWMIAVTSAPCLESVMSLKLIACMILTLKRSLYISRDGIFEEDAKWDWNLKPSEKIDLSWGDKGVSEGEEIDAEENIGEEGEGTEAVEQKPVQQRMLMSLQRQKKMLSHQEKRLKQVSREKHQEERGNSHPGCVIL